MDSMKNTILSLAVLLLLLGCVAAGKYLFMPDTTIDAQATKQNKPDEAEPQLGRFQISCTTNTADDGVPVCVIIDTVSGRVVNVIQPKAEKLCGGQGRKAGTIDCNNTLNKYQNNKKAAANANGNTANKTQNNPNKGGGKGNGTDGGKGNGSGSGTGSGSGQDKTKK